MNNIIKNYAVIANKDISKMQSQIRPAEKSVSSQLANVENRKPCVVLKLI